MKEGATVDDFLRPDRIVVGCGDARAEVMRKYAPFLRTGKPFLAMDLASAEMSKLAVNAYLRPHLRDERSRHVCEAAGADVSHVLTVAADGASRLPVSGLGLAALPAQGRNRLRGLGRNAGAQAPARGHRRGPDATLRRFIGRILSFMANRSRGNASPSGATFKPRTDDLRGATCALSTPAEGAAVHIRPRRRQSRPCTATASGRRQNYDALADADGLVICTE